MDRETATWCVTVAVRDAVVGRTVVGRDVVGRAVVGRAVGVMWWGVPWWGCAVVGRDAGNLYLNSGNPGKSYRKQQHNKNEKENCLWQK